jgi:hypothetical protein
MRSRWAPSSSAQASGHRWQIPTLGARIFAGTTGMAGAGSPTGVLCSGSPPPRVRAAGGSRASTGTIPQGAGPLLCEVKNGPVEGPVPRGCRGQPGSPAVRGGPLVTAVVRLSMPQLCPKAHDDLPRAPNPLKNDREPSGVYRGPRQTLASREDPTAHPASRTPYRAAVTIAERRGVRP